MTESKKRIPIIFDLKNAKTDYSRYRLLFSYYNPFNKGNFPLVDTRNLEEVVNTAEKEIFSYPFEIVSKTGEIKYAQTITGYRDNKRYIFKVNKECSLNQTIQNCFPKWPVLCLNFPRKSAFCFYFILNRGELTIFASVFSKWSQEKFLDNNTDQ